MIRVRRDKDIYEKKSDIRALFSDSFRDSEPLAKLIDAVVDMNMLRDIATEHCKGRRLYVGTTELDARRLVVWDMGEIAKRGTEADLAGKFKSGGKAYVSTGPATNTCKYEESGKAVTLTCEGDKTVFTRHDDESLTGPPGSMIGALRKSK